jgi:hypothetical protein
MNLYVRAMKRRKELRVPVRIFVLNAKAQER